MNSVSLKGPDQVVGEYTGESTKTELGLKTQLSIKLLDEDMIVIEASAAGLRLLGDLLEAVSNASDCHFSLSPTGAGNAYFRDETGLGLYIHRVPCEHKTKPRPD